MEPDCDAAAGIRGLGGVKAGSDARPFSTFEM